MSYLLGFPIGILLGLGIIYNDASYIGISILSFLLLITVKWYFWDKDNKIERKNR